MAPQAQFKLLSCKLQQQFNYHTQEWYQFKKKDFWKVHVILKFFSIEKFVSLKRPVVSQATLSLSNPLVLIWWNFQRKWKVLTWTTSLAVQMDTNSLLVVNTLTCEETNTQPHNALQLVINSQNILVVDTPFTAPMVVGYSKMAKTGQCTKVAKNVAQEMVAWSISVHQLVLWMKTISHAHIQKVSMPRSNAHRPTSVM